MSLLGRAAMWLNAASANADLAAELAVSLHDQRSAAHVAQYWPALRKSVLESESSANSNAYLTPEQMKDIVASSVLSSRAMSSNINSPTIDIEAKSCLTSCGIRCGCCRHSWRNRHDLTQQPAISCFLLFQQ